MFDISKTKNRGFTLMETLIAIAVLSLAITGPMVIAQKGIGSAIYARDEVTAFYLAQEAVEYIRNIRDTNRIADYIDPNPPHVTDWLWELDSNGANCVDTSGQKCQIDAAAGSPAGSFLSPVPGGGLGAVINACSGGVCPPIDFNSATNFYGYGSGGTWTPTQFTRTIDIKTLSAYEAVVTVTISWQTNVFTPSESFVVAEHIFAF